METVQTNRRVNRSDDVQVALSFQLAETARRAKFSSIALADDLGTVIAAAGNKEVCEHMAALSPILATTSTMPWYGSINTEEGEVRASITPVLIDNSLLYLSAAGGRKASAPALLQTSGSGVTRILE